MASYSSAKNALTHFSQSFDEEMREYGIRILVSCPGKIATDFTQKASNLPSCQREKYAMSTASATKKICRQIEKKFPQTKIFGKQFLFFYILTRLLSKKSYLPFLKKEMNLLYKKCPFQDQL